MHATGNLDIWNVEIDMLRTLKLTADLHAHAQGCAQRAQNLKVLEFLTENCVMGKLSYGPRRDRVYLVKK
jgi:hypothetical protein